MLIMVSKGAPSFISVELVERLYEVLGILSILLAQAINRMVCLEAVWLKWPILLVRVTNRMVCVEAV